MGEQGLFKVRYLGDMNGKWRGKETCHFYEFTVDEPVRYVDKRDIEAFLEVRDGSGGSLFERG